MGKWRLLFWSDVATPALQTSPPARFDSSRFHYYDFFVLTFVVILLISNLVGQKICAIGPFRVSGAQLLFPLTYIFGDVFTEVYGYAGSRRAIWLGFFACALLSVMGWITVAMPASPEWHNQAAFETVFYTVPRMVLASLIAFLAGEFANSLTLAKMKVFTEGKHLWSRIIGSTVVGQLVDTVVLVFVAFGGTQPMGELLKLIGSAYLAKVLYEVIATPATYAVVNFLKRREGVDVFDTHTDFSPFHVR